MFQLKHFQQLSYFILFIILCSTLYLFLAHKQLMNENKEAAKEAEIQPGIIQQKITKTNGEITIKKYTRGKLLGKGGFAKCYELTNIETKRLYAAKIIAKNSLNKSRAKQKLITQIKIHKSLSHPSIVKFQHVFQDQENVYILLEICSSQTLNELIKRRKKLTEMQVQYYLAQIVSSLIYLHQNKIIHRDLKLGNLFLNENMEIKLGDFGLATRIQVFDQKKKTICGTPNYIAPQILQGKGHAYEVDIWSVGVIIYTQIIGKPPFQTPEVKSTYKKIKSGSYTFPQGASISDNAKNLILKILVLDPSKRPTLPEILSDSFMSGPIPKTLPKSTTSMPPPKIFMDSIAQNTESIKMPSSANNAQKTAPKQQKKETAQPYVTPQTQIYSKQQKQSNTASKINSKGPKQSLIQIHVKKWVDYSTKYGLGYLLSDGSTGVYFNDSTKIIADFKGQNFEYIQKKAGQKADSISTYKMSDYPPQRQLQKKVTLLHHFKNYLSNDNKYQFDNAAPNYCYVKKWMKTKHAIMFRLSNKIVQVNFTDKTQIILSSQQKMVSYINIKGQRSEYQLATALDSKNVEMAKRLKYTKQILTHMLNGTSIPQGKDDLN